MAVSRNQSQLLVPKQKGYIQLSTLVLVAFCSAFFPRVLSLLKFPSIVNLVHLGFVPWVCLFTLWKTRVKDREQIAIAHQLIFALFCFLTVNVASALLNDAGIINVAVNFLLLCEHFLFLLPIICIPFSPDKLIYFRAFIIASSLINTLFAYVQHYVLQLHHRQGLEDNIKGVFIEQGAGHVIGASVALTFGVYYFGAAKTIPLWFRIFLALATFWHMNMADAKQVLFAFGVAGIILIITKLTNLLEAIKFTFGLSLLGGTFWWAINNLPGFGAFQTWLRPEIYGPEGEATLLKSATFRVVPNFYTTPLHPFLGLGPGHTVGRLGGWMLREYSSLLEPLGSTRHSASGAVWGVVAESWLGDKSSMFSPLFGWAGIWGDLGWLGLISFLGIWLVIWRKLCHDDISRFLVLTPLVFGLIFSQMEEPGYMLYVASIVGLRWQEHHCQAKSRDKLILPPPEQKPLPKKPKEFLKRILLLE